VSKYESEVLMFSFFKEKKMKKELETVNLEKQFDFQISEAYQIDAKTNSHYAINSYVFTAHSYEKRQSMYFMLTITPEQTNAMIYYSEGFNKYTLDQQIYTTNCPLKINKEDDKWNIVFNGYLKKNNKDNAKFTFSAKFESINEAVEKSSNIKTNNLFNAFKGQKNYQDKIKQLQEDKNISYDQLGKLKGRLILEGQNVIIDVSCVKIHTYGNYDYSLINNHMNLILADKESQLDIHIVSEPNMSLLETGNYRKMNGNINYINFLKYERQLLTKGIAPANLNVLIGLDNEKEVSIHIKNVDIFEYELQEQYDIVISIVEVLMEGKKYRGIMECGFNKDKQKWFNGNDLSAL